MLSRKGVQVIRVLSGDAEIAGEAKAWKATVIEMSHFKI